jgi:hypothetical protein
VDLGWRDFRFVPIPDIGNPLTTPTTARLSLTTVMHFLDPDGFEFEPYCGMDLVNKVHGKRPEHQFHRVKSLEDAVAHPLPAAWRARI